MRAVIIDDEINSQEVLALALEQFIEGISVVGRASSVKTGVAIIDELKPQLVFLDIELPDGTGFDILEKINNKNVNVIFITAFDNFALKAYRYAAVDYLMKPISIDELTEATDRAKQKKENLSDRLEFLQSKLSEDKSTFNEILVEGNQKFIKISLDDIISIEAQTGVATLRLSDGRQILSTRPLKFYEELLKENKFYRIHRAHIINLSKISSIDKGRTVYARMSDGTALEIAARRKSQLLDLVKR